MLELKLNHVSKSGPWCRIDNHFDVNVSTDVNGMFQENLIDTMFTDALAHSVSRASAAIISIIANSVIEPKKISITTRCQQNRENTEIYIYMLLSLPYFISPASAGWGWINVCYDCFTINTHETSSQYILITRTPLILNAWTESCYPF